MEINGLILIGTTVGWIGGQYMTGKGFGVIADIIAGVAGALIGGTLFGKIGIFAGSGLIGSLLFAITGSIVLLYGIRRVKNA